MNKIPSLASSSLELIPYDKLLLDNARELCKLFIKGSYGNWNSRIPYTNVPRSHTKECVAVFDESRAYHIPHNGK